MKSAIIFITLFLVARSYAQNCSTGEVACPGSGQCISEDYLCDGWIDCGDDSWDEIGACVGLCDGYQCTQSGECIDESWVCDGEADCPGGDDEPESCPPCFSCPEDDYCLPSSWVCDDYYDCLSGEDELNCPTTARPPCNGFECPSGQCISAGWVCDGDNDCGDYSDESGCECADGEVNCGRCIPESWYCDTVPDCPDGSDEANCTLASLSAITPKRHNFLAKKHMTVLEKSQKLKSSKMSSKLVSLTAEEKLHKHIVRKQNIHAARKLRK